MSETLEFLVHHGYLVLFLWVLAEQAGLPVPSVPLLLAAGALAGTRRMNLVAVVGLPIVAVAICDSLWYQLGRTRGAKVLKLLCRISLQADSCVRKTQISFERNGPSALIIAKFIPGLNAMAPPLAGMIRMPWDRFLLFDGLGALLWAGSYIGAGYIFSGELERVAHHLTFLGRGLFALMVIALGCYIALKYFTRRRFLRKLRIARITPEELKRKIDGQEDVIIVDLRHTAEFAADPVTIPGAVHMDAGDLEEGFHVIPRDREIVLFCNCPNEATAAQLALRLRDLGITRIRPLAEGLGGWRRRGFPTQAIASRIDPYDAVNEPTNV
jgi:membrane protein DedA with SNARE-associated domain/rhodanese-related sulfurtransferase